MNETNYLSHDGAQQMKKELEHLKTTTRQEIAERLRFAIQQGDLSENADYTATKEEQGFIEGRIQELEYLLGNATIIDEPRVKDVVVLGSKVTIQEADFPPETFQLLGAKEADPVHGIISNESPVGRSLIGKKVGSIVTTKTPGGQIKFKILKIH